MSDTGHGHNTEEGFVHGEGCDGLEHPAWTCPEHMAPQPRTEAGRTFLAALETMDRLDPCHPTPVDWRHGIVTVEAEAAALERERMRPRIFALLEEPGAVTVIEPSK